MTSSISGQKMTKGLYSSEVRTSMSIGPRKLLRIGRRLVMWSALTWFLLALLWAFLPSPSTERDGNNGSDYPTAVLRAGKTLTRVYESNIFRVDSIHRSGFALDYTLNTSSLCLSISGSETELPIFNNELSSADNVSIRLQVEAVARMQDPDGANLPWFQFADSVLLSWWVQKEYINVSLAVEWDMEDDRVQRMNLRVMGRRSIEPLLTMEMQSNNISTLAFIAPARPLSSSPSMTYPIRIAIIHLIAPPAIFINDLLSAPIGVIFNSLVTAVYVLLIVTLYGFLLILFLCLASLLLSCLGGPSLEILVARIQDRINSLNQNERLHLLRIDAIRERLDWLYQNQRVKAALDICRNGWHQQRERERVHQVEKPDVEKATSTKS